MTGCIKHKTIWIDRYGGENEITEMADGSASKKGERENYER